MKFVIGHQGNIRQTRLSNRARIVVQKQELDFKHHYCYSTLAKPYLTSFIFNFEFISPQICTRDTVLKHSISQDAFLETTQLNYFKNLYSLLPRLQSVSQLGPEKGCTMRDQLQKEIGLGNTSQYLQPLQSLLRTIQVVSVEEREIEILSELTDQERLEK